MRKNRNEYQRQYQLKRYHRRRKTILQMLGGKCIKCGSIANLEIDHVDYKTKSFHINKLWSIAWDKVLNEIKKCQLLCKRCHIEKSEIDLDNIGKRIPRRVCSLMVKR